MKKSPQNYEDLNAGPLSIRTMEVGVLGLERTLSAIQTFDLSVFELEEGLRMWSATRRQLRPSMQYCFPYWSVNQGDKSWEKIHPSLLSRIADMFQRHFPVRNFTEDTWMGEGFIPGVQASHVCVGVGPYSSGDRSRFDIKRFSSVLYSIGRQTFVPGLPYEIRRKVNSACLTEAENLILEEIHRCTLEIEVRGGLRSKLLAESASCFERDDKRWDAINARLRGGFNKKS